MMKKSATSKKTSGTSQKMTAWDHVLIARHAERPTFHDYVKHICSDFIELHGDRLYGDDRALLGGFATIGRQKVMLIGMDKGKTTEDKIKSNFGMPNPEGYRKALRLMRLAEKYKIPVVCLVDTPAAYPGRGAEERGQAEAIASNLVGMAALETPIVVMITGEGGSGGALAVAVGDVVMMLSHSIYSVIPPEGCAAILWRDGSKGPEAAQALKVDSTSLLASGVIDEVIQEPKGGAHNDPVAAMDAVKEAVVRHIKRLNRYSSSRLVAKRYDKFAKMGEFQKLK
jgi:acetyl-CoA carboxylase carboxyl transferase subunit alpha